MSAGLVALGAAVGLDRTAWGQTLLAHPGVAAPLAGWLAGAPVQGIWLGLCLTLLSASHVPVGRERLRDHASVAVAIPLALGAGSPDWAWGAALLAGLLLAPVAAWPIAGVRELSRRALVRCRRQATAGVVPPVEALHFGLAGLHLLRGAVTVILLALLLRLVAWLLGAAGEIEQRSLALLWVAAPAAGLPRLLRTRGRGQEGLWAVLGLLCGAVLVWWRKGGATWMP